MSSNALKGICSFILFVVIIATAILPTPNHPVFSQNPSPQTIESDDARVNRAGNWSNQATNAASGGSYLFGGAIDQSALSLQFYGPDLEIIYVSGPMLGTLAVEVDGTVLRTIITAADAPGYGQHTSFNYLSEEWHTVRVYAQEGGTVAIDAFVALLDGPAKGSENPDSNGNGPRLASLNQVIINELGDYPGVPGYAVELLNPTVAPVTLTNWQMRFYNAAIPLTFTFPTFTLQPGAYVTVVTTGVTNSDTVLLANVAYDINFNNNQAIALNNNLGQGVDFVRWGGSTVTPLAPDTFTGNLPNSFVANSIQSVGREQNDDDNNVGDWSQQCATLGRPNNNCLVLNEFYTGGVDALEIFNPTDYAYNLLLYDVNIYGPGTTLNGTFDFPAYTIQPGTYVVLHEGTGTNSGNHLYAGFNFVWESTYGGASLEDTVNTLLDVAQWGTTTVFNGDPGWQSGSIAAAPSSNSSVARRASGEDSNSPTDFCAQNSTLGTVNHGCVVINEVFGGDPEWVEIYNTSIASYDLSFYSVSFATGNASNFIYQFATFILPANGYVRIIEGAGTNTSTTVYTGGNNLLNWGAGDSGMVYLYSGVHALDFVRWGSNIMLAGAGTTFTSPNAPALPAAISTQSIGRSVSGRDFDNGADWCVQTTVTGGARNYGCNSRIAVFAPGTSQISLVDNNTNPPAPNAYNTFDSGLPAGGLNGQWVMGDWNGDGRDTPGVYGSNGVFYFTNQAGPIQNSDWHGIWFGLLSGVVPNAPIAGRFNAAVQNDCIGIVDSGNFPPYGVAFVLYFTCDMIDGNPPKTFQWLSVLLPDNQGFTGTFQFGAGNFDNNGVDSVAVQRGNFIAYSLTDPTTFAAAFPLAQYFAPPIVGSSIFLIGDFDGDSLDSFGMYFPASGVTYFKNDLDWNSGAPPVGLYIGFPLGSSTTAATWRGY